MSSILALKNKPRETKQLKVANYLIALYSVIFTVYICIFSMERVGLTFWFWDRDHENIWIWSQKFETKEIADL